MIDVARFSKIDRRLWSDRGFLSLSDDARMVWFYLLTGPDVTRLPGVIVAGKAHIAEVLGWVPERFAKGFGELSRKGMARADWDARLVWLPNALKYNPPDNGNVAKGWADDWDNVPECELKIEISSAFYSACERLGDGFAKPFAVGIGNGIGKGMANQEQEQEQEQEQDKDLSDGAAKPARPPAHRKPASGPHAEFIAVFCDAWKGQYGDAYPFADAKDGAAIKWARGQLKDDLAKWSRIVDRYLDDPDPFYHGHTLDKLRSQFARWLTDKPPPRKAADKSTNAFMEGLAAFARDGPENIE